MIAARVAARRFTAVTSMSHGGASTSHTVPNHYAKCPIQYQAEYQLRMMRGTALVVGCGAAALFKFFSIRSAVRAGTYEA
jgi:hypothetical protein